jgi:hypothetical protein
MFLDMVGEVHRVFKVVEHRERGDYFCLFTGEAILKDRVREEFRNKTDVGRVMLGKLFSRWVYAKKTESIGSTTKYLNLIPV